MTPAGNRLATRIAETIRYRVGADVKVINAKWILVHDVEERFVVRVSPHVEAEARNLRDAANVRDAWHEFKRRRGSRDASQLAPTVQATIPPLGPWGTP